MKRYQPLFELGGSRGPAWLWAHWLAEDLRQARTKAQRVAIATRLERLSVFLAQQFPVSRRGRPMHAETWRRFGLALALVQLHGVKKGTAARAVCGKDKAGAERVRHLVYRWLERGNTGTGIPSFNERELTVLVERLKAD